MKFRGPKERTGELGKEKERKDTEDASLSTLEPKTCRQAGSIRTSLSSKTTSQPCVQSYSTAGSTQQFKEKSPRRVC